MKKFIFLPVILFVAILLVSGCYTYLSLSDGAQLAEVSYEPYDLPMVLNTGTRPPCIDCNWPEPVPRPIIVIINPPPDDLKPAYERPKEISDLRNGGESRYPNTDKRKR